MRHARRRVLASLVVFAAVALAGSVALAIDIQAYQRLLDASTQAHEQLDAAPPEDLPRVLEQAEAADRALIEWLEETIASEEFQALNAQQQAAFFRGRFRAEYNLAGVLIPLDRCEEARDGVRSLLDSEVNDEELRPVLVERYDEANLCLTRERVVTLIAVIDPVNAILMVDGVFLGTADTPQQVELGEHTISIHADGYYSQERTINAVNEGDTITMGPIILEALPAVGAPKWYEWTLWGAGATGIGLGIYFYIDARNQEDRLQNPGEGLEVEDPQAAQDAVDRRDLAAIIFGSIGIVCAVAGTWSYLARQGDDDEPEEGVSLLFGPTAVVLDYRW